MRYAVLREVEKQVVIYENDPVIPLDVHSEAHEKWLKEDCEFAEREDDQKADGEVSAKEGCEDPQDATAAAYVMDVDSFAPVAAPPQETSALVVSPTQPRTAESSEAATGSDVKTEAPSTSLIPKVIKTIKKLEVELLCSQHNPVCLFHFFRLFSSMHVL